MSPKVAKEATKKRKRASLPALEKPEVGYLDEQKIKRGVMALKKYLKTRATTEPSNKKKKPKNLLEAGQKDSSQVSKVFVEVVFKNIPNNMKTYIHNIVLPHHWRKNLAPEDYDIALFVPHKKPENEAQKIQFSRDRELDLENTHSHYQQILDAKLNDENRARISRIITSKELATEFDTPQKLGRLSKTYNLFLGDKKLVCNKFNALLRRLGRRFWVREKKVPLSIKMASSNLNERFDRVLSTEPFYVLGRSSTEKIHVSLSNQKTEEIVENIQAFLNRLYALYGDNVRFIRLRANKGLPLPLFADLSTICPKEVKMQKKRVKRKPIISDFDLIDDEGKVKVLPSGLVRTIYPKRKTSDSLDEPTESVETVRPKKKVKN